MSYTYDRDIVTDFIGKGKVSFLRPITYVKPFPVIVFVIALDYFVVPKILSGTQYSDIGYPILFAGTLILGSLFILSMSVLAFNAWYPNIGIINKGKCKK